MAEYIDRGIAIAKLTALEVTERNATMTSAKRLLAYMPAADVAPVRHGEWEIVVGSNGKEYMVCTCCRVSQDLTGVFTYCPNCGSKMDGGED